MALTWAAFAPGAGAAETKGALPLTAQVAQAAHVAPLNEVATQVQNTVAAAPVKTPPVPVKQAVAPVKKAVAPVKQAVAPVKQAVAPVKKAVEPASVQPAPAGGSDPTKDENASTGGKPIGAAKGSPGPGKVEQALSDVVGAATKGEIGSQATGVVGALNNGSPSQVEVPSAGVGKVVGGVAGQVNSTLDDVIGGLSNGGGSGGGLDSILGGVADSALGGVTGPLIGTNSVLGYAAGGLSSTLGGVTGSIQSSLSEAGDWLGLPDAGSSLGAAAGALSALAPQSAGPQTPDASAGAPLPFLPDQMLDSLGATNAAMNNGAAGREAGSSAPFSPNAPTLSQIAAFEMPADGPASGTHRAPGGPGDPGNVPGTFSGAAQGGPNGLFLFGFAALLLVALMAAAPAIRRLIQIPPASWQPVPFISLLERPG